MGVRRPTSNRPRPTSNRPSHRGVVSESDRDRSRDSGSTPGHRKMQMIAVLSGDVPYRSARVPSRLIESGMSCQKTIQPIGSRKTAGEDQK